MKRLSFALPVLLVGCAIRSGPQTGERPALAATLAEQQSRA